MKKQQLLITVLTGLFTAYLWEYQVKPIITKKG